MATADILSYLDFFAKRRKRVQKDVKYRSRMTSGAMKRIAPLYKVTALQWAAEFLHRCQQPCDLSDQAGFVGRIVDKLGEITQDEANAGQLRAIEQAIKILQSCQAGPCDYSSERAHLEALGDVLLTIRPGPE